LAQLVSVALSIVVGILFSQPEDGSHITFLFIVYFVVEGISKVSSHHPSNWGWCSAARCRSALEAYASMTFPGLVPCRSRHPADRRGAAPPIRLGRQGDGAGAPAALSGQGFSHLPLRRADRVEERAADGA
jgi:hypothetical protein